MFKKKSEEPKNPNGLRRVDWEEKYKDTPSLAMICWYFGIYPEELIEEIKKLTGNGQSKGNNEGVMT